MISALKKNDEIITTGGIHATIVNVKEKTYVIRVDDNTRIEISKTAVAGLKRKPEENKQ
jgi:preprotein translocase subunit YajC